METVQTVAEAAIAADAQERSSLRDALQNARPGDLTGKNEVEVDTGQKPPEPEPDAGSLKSKPDDKGQPVAESKPKDGQQKIEAPMTKEQKETARLDKTWQNANAIKEANEAKERELKQIEERVQAERHAWEMQRQQQIPLPRTRDEKGHSADDYRKWAAEFERDGETEYARLAKAQAEKLSQVDARMQQENQERTFHAMVNDNVLKQAREYPDLNEPNSQMFKDVVQIMNQYPILKTMPDGIKYAVDGWKMQQAGSKSSELEKTNAALEKELETLRKKLTVGGSQASDSPNGEQDFDSLSDEEQKRYLRKRMNALA